MGDPPDILVSWGWEGKICICKKHLTNGTIKCKEESDIHQWSEQEQTRKKLSGYEFNYIIETYHISQDQQLTVYCPRKIFLGGQRSHSKDCCSTF